MDELAVTKLWMLGVVLMMVVYGGFAVAGYHRRNEAENEKCSAAEQ